VTYAQLCTTAIKITTLPQNGVGPAPPSQENRNVMNCFTKT